MHVKRIIISVTNDLISDQRVNRVATTLSEEGLNVLLVGRVLPNSPPLDQRVYSMHRMKVPFTKGFQFYATYNIWLFFYLLFHKCDALLANDLDSLPANYFASKIKRIPLIFDSHEYFPEVPELVNRPRVKKTWEKIEGFFLPRIKYGYTVCESIANIYKTKYGTSLMVVRNLPFRNTESIAVGKTEKHIIMYQGAINLGRGIELVMEAMRFIDNATMLIAGDGDIMTQIKEKAQDYELKDKVVILGRLPMQKLKEYTTRASLGFSLEENLGLNYYFALPNKLFDYVQAGVPVITSDFPEMARIVNGYNIGLTTNERDPQKLAAIISDMIQNEEKRSIWKTNLKKAASELCWENEKHTLLAVYKKAGLF
jgi:glycosyltransferase involved in cell wall biosynthesis